MNLGFNPEAIEQEPTSNISQQPEPIDDYNAGNMYGATSNINTNIVQNTSVPVYGTTNEGQAQPTYDIPQDISPPNYAATTNKPSNMNQPLISSYSRSPPTPHEEYYESNDNCCDNCCDCNCS